MKIIDAHMHLPAFPDLMKLPIMLDMKIRQPITLQPAMKMALS